MRRYNCRLCGGCSSVGRVQDCDSCRRGFESHQPPQINTQTRRRGVPDLKFLPRAAEKTAAAHDIVCSRQAWASSLNRFSAPSGSWNRPGVMVNDAPIAMLVLENHAEPGGPDNFLPVALLGEGIGAAVHGHVAEHADSLVTNDCLVRWKHSFQDVEVRANCLGTVPKRRGTCAPQHRLWIVGGENPIYARPGLAPSRSPQRLLAFSSVSFSDAPASQPPLCGPTRAAALPPPPVHRPGPAMMQPR